MLRCPGLLLAVVFMAAETAGGPTGIDCEDFNAINSACPVPASGRLVPMSCPTTGSATESCASVYTRWYAECFDSLRFSFSEEIDTQQLTEYNDLCLTGLNQRHAQDLPPASGASDRAGVV